MGAGACGSQRSSLDPFELGLQAVVSSLMRLLAIKLHLMEERSARLDKEPSLQPIAMVFKAACLEVLCVIVLHLIFFFFLFHVSVLQDTEGDER